MAATKSSDRDVTIVDGSVDFSGGVNSDVVTTIQSDLNPNGLKRTQLSWMNNATVRGGGILQRTGWNNLGNLPTGTYQGSFMYYPRFDNPYLVMVVQGRIYKVDVQTVPPTVTDLSAAFKLTLPVTERCYFCQGEEFLIIQAGDNVTLPLFWNNTTLRRSIGVNPLATPASGPGVSELPAATNMCYYGHRVWYAQGRTLLAGDIAGGPSGTAATNRRDSLLSVTENPLCVGGDGILLPTTTGNIRGIAYASNLNTQLGQGTLYVGTREVIYAVNVPITRTDWINANQANGPTVVVALESNGWVSDRSIVAVNGDLFFQSLEPSIRSLTTAIRNFQQWGNVPISTNEERILQFNDRALMHLSSGIYFDNRMLQTVMPYTCPVGVAHKAIVPLNFDVISTLENRLPPCWEAMWEGINFLELTIGDFGGRERAFALSWSDVVQKIELWELTVSDRWDNNTSNRVEWYIEFPAFTFGEEFELKKLIGAELWLDKLLGEVVFKIEYRPDGDPCWFPWHSWKFCTAKDTCETVHAPVCVYPQSLRESYRETVTIPRPPANCARVMGRPANVAYQFQAKLSIKGWCRIRGLLLHAERVDRKLYDHLTC